MKLLLLIWLAIFTGLKLVGVLHWSWLLVLSPLWIYLGLFLILLLTTFIVELMNKP